MNVSFVFLAVTVYQSVHPLIRVGPDYDGGYVIAAIKNADGSDFRYDFLVSGGIGSPQQGGTVFEETILSYDSALHGVVYDHTVSSVTPHPRLTWHKQPVGNTNGHGGHGGDNLHYYLNHYHNLFVKIDIEAAEFVWLPTVRDEQLQSIAQLVIEWHSVGLWQDWHWELLHRVTKTHKLVHVHACNCCGFINVPCEEGKTIKVPHVFEATYVRRDLDPGSQPSTQPIPSKLDMPNLRDRADISITWPPFVFPKSEL